LLQSCITQRTRTMISHVFSELLRPVETTQQPHVQTFALKVEYCQLTIAVATCQPVMTARLYTVSIMLIHL